MERWHESQMLFGPEVGGGGGSSLRLKAPGALILCAGGLWAIGPVAFAQGPSIQGEQVQRGTARFERLDGRTIIRASDGAIINYRQFDVGAGQTVQFIQPGSDARVLNRIQSAAPSRIDGQLLANGQVYLVNRAGVIFGQGSIVNASRLVAAGGDLSNADFAAGRDRFTNVQGAIVNEGAISANGVTLVGSAITNHGTIVTAPDEQGNPRGIVTLATGGEVFVQEEGSAIRVRVEQQSSAGPSDVRRQPPVSGAGPRPGKRRVTSLGAGDAAAHALAIQNTGTIQANGGNVTLAAASGTIRNEGTIASNSPATTPEDSQPPSQAASSVVVEPPVASVRIDGPRVEQVGTIDVSAAAPEADAPFAARGGVIEIEAGNRLFVASGSAMVAGGTDDGAGTIALRSSGDLVVESGSIVDAGVGAIQIDADRSMRVEGELRAIRSAAMQGGTAGGDGTGQLLLGGDAAGSIYVRDTGAQDGELGDGRVTRTDVGDQTFVVSASAIENFAGDVLLSTPLDIVIERSITKLNGGLTLDAGREIVFGRATPMGVEGETGLIDVGIAARFLDFTSTGMIRDLTQAGAQLAALGGDIKLRSNSAGVQFGRATVASGSRVEWTQAESLALSGVQAKIANSQDVHVAIDVTSGTLTLGNAGGAGQSYRSLAARASGGLVVNEQLTSATTIDLTSLADLRIGASLSASERVTAWAGAGSGGGGGGDLSFSAAGLSIASSAIELRAGTHPGAWSPSQAIPESVIDVRTNAPMFVGTGGTGTSPARFEFSQNRGFSDASLPTQSQFGDGTAGLLYLAQSFYESITIADARGLTGARATLNAHSAFNPIQPGSLKVMDSLDLASFASLGTVELFANVTTTGEQFYEDRVYVGGEVTLRASRVQFEAPVTSTLGPPDVLGSLAINGDATFEMGAGDLRPLREVRVDGRTTLGRTDVTADEFLVRMLTEGDQTYRGGLRLLTDASLRSSDGGIISVGGDIEGGLSAILARPLNLSISTNDGLIAFGSGTVPTMIGAGTRLGTLSLSTSDSPSTRGGEEAATVIGRNDLTVRADAIEFAQGEKLTVLGDLDMSADRIAVGDINTRGAMRLLAETITLLRRPAGTLRDQVGNLLTDLGLDFVAGGAIAFSGDIVLAGDSEAAPRFGSRTGEYSGNLSLFDQVTMLASEVAPERFVGVGNEVLDLRVPERGPPPPPPPAGPGGLEDPRPRDPGLEVIVLPRVYDIELLRRVAVSGRGVDAAEMIAARSGRYVYSDLPEGEAATDANEVRIAATRFNSKQVRDAVIAHDEILGEPGSDRSVAVAAQIESLVRQYQAARSHAAGDATNAVEPRELAWFLATSPQQEETMRTLLSLRGVLDRVRGLGLTDREFAESQRRLLAGITPADGSLTVDGLATLVHSAGEEPTRRLGARW
jgi:filamentous hemagglutinin family protein